MEMSQLSFESLGFDWSEMETNLREIPEEKNLANYGEMLLRKLIEMFVRSKKIKMHIISHFFDYYL